jgi:CubicO group peptidase (beta-lactamase class C family)
MAQAVGLALDDQVPVPGPDEIPELVKPAATIHRLVLSGRRIFMKTESSVALILVLFALSCTPAADPAIGRQNGGGTSPVDRVVTRLTERMRFYRVPGVGIAVIDGFEIAWAHGYGTIRAGGEEPVDDAMGMGFELSGSEAKLAFLHTGGTWGSTAILWAYPGTGQGAVIMTNSATGSLLRFEILLAIANEYGWPMLS